MNDSSVRGEQCSQQHGLKIGISPDGNYLP